MKIILTSIGTRGDIEPFLALGEYLYTKGHEIIFLFPEQFENLIPNHQQFHALSARFIELVESDQGKIVMGKAGVLAKLKAILYLCKEGLKVNKELMKQQYKIIEKETPDLILHNVKCNYPLLWGLKYNKTTIMVSPVPYLMYYTKGHSHIGINKNMGAFLNKLTYRLSNLGLIKTIYDAQKHIPTNKEFSKSQIKKALFSKKLMYTISPSLFARPNYWDDHVQVMGYHERNKSIDWKPTEELTDFLKSNTKIVFLTFGSMVSSFPLQISKMIYNILLELKTACVINTAAGGLVKLKEFETKENLFFTEQIPYDWILPKVNVIIHHGGSGTTHTGLKHGCATLIIPHIIDQFGWNNLIYKIGAGPKGISINKLTSDQFRRLLKDVTTKDTYKQNAKKIANKMASESLNDKLYDFIMHKQSKSSKC